MRTKADGAALAALHEMGLRRLGGLIYQSDDEKTRVIDTVRRQQHLAREERALRHRDTQRTPAGYRTVGPSSTMQTPNAASASRRAKGEPFFAAIAKLAQDRVDRVR